MKKKASRNPRYSDRDRDTLRSAYDFSGATRGATVTNYRQGTNVFVIDPDVLDVFPDAASVNRALRAIAGLVRQRRRPRPMRRRP
jgi:hypothetical protein